MTALNVNLRVLAGKLHNVTFGVITRNITRLIKTPISHWFIYVFDEPVFLLIRRSLVRAQVEEPPKKASSKAMLFPFIRNYLSRWGPVGDFLPSNFIKLLHTYYTVDGSSQEVFVTAWIPPLSHHLFVHWALLGSKFTLHGGGDFFSTGCTIGFEDVF